MQGQKVALLGRAAERGGDDMILPDIAAVAPEPTCERCVHRRPRPWPPPWASAPQFLPGAPVRLDYAASDGHSCGCPFGPRANLKLQQPQLPRSGPNGQPTESSQLGRPTRVRTVP